MHKTEVSVYDTNACWGAWRVNYDTKLFDYGPEQNGGKWYKEYITNREGLPLCVPGETKRYDVGEALISYPLHNGEIFWGLSL